MTAASIWEHIIRYRVSINGNNWDVIGGPHYREGYEEGKKAVFSLLSDKIWLLPEE